jgi:hypothetical protein
MMAGAGAVVGAVADRVVFGCWNGVVPAKVWEEGFEIAQRFEKAGLVQNIEPARLTLPGCSLDFPPTSHGGNAERGGKGERRGEGEIVAEGARPDATAFFDIRIDDDECRPAAGDTVMGACRRKRAAGSSHEG